MLLNQIVVSAVRRRRLGALFTGLILALAGLVASPAAAATGAIAGNVGQSGVSVAVYPTGSQTPVSTVLSSSDGSFTIDDLAPGSYEIYFSKQTFVPEWFGGDESRGSATPVTVTDGAQDLTTTTLVRGGTLSGSLTSAGVRVPISEVRVWRLLDGAWERDSSSSPSFSNGTFTYSLTTAQPIKLAVLPRVDTGYDFPVWYGDAYSRDTAQELTVAPGQTRTNVNLAVTGTGTVSGKVTNEFGGPVTGGTVEAWVKDHGQVVKLDQVGKSFNSNGYTVKVPADVDVTIRASAVDFTTTWLGNSTGPETATYRQISKTESRTGFDIALTGGRGIRGTIRQPNDFRYNQGSAVAGAEVLGWSGDKVISRATTDGNGRYYLGGLSWMGTADVQIQVVGEGLIGGWLQQRNAPLSATRPPLNTSRWGPWSDADFTWVDAIADYDSSHRLIANGPLTLHTRPVISDIGRLEFTVPTWNQTPDTIFLRLRRNGETYASEYELSELSGRIAFWPSLENGTYEAEVIAIKAGLASVSTGKVTFTAESTRVISRPVLRGTPLIGQTLTFTPAKLNAGQDSLPSHSWLRDGKRVSGVASYKLTAADVGKWVHVEQTIYFGSRTFFTSSSKALIRTTSRLTTTARSTRSKARKKYVTLSWRLDTPGATRPGGTVRIYRGKTLVRTIAPVASRSTALKVPVRKGSHAFTVRYSGSPIAPAASRSVQVRVR